MLNSSSFFEELVRRECSDLPALIFRPAIIAGIWKDGIPGWADAYQGMTANALGVSSFFFFIVISFFINDLQ